MSHSKERSLKFLGVLVLGAVAGLGCSVKGIQNRSQDGGADAGGRDGGKGDVRGLDAAAGRSVAGNSGGAGASGGAGGIFISLPGGAGSIFVSSLAGTSSSGGASSTSSSSRNPDGGPFDTNRPDTRDAAGGTGGSVTVKLDANLVDAYRADTRDAPLGGSGGASASGGTGGTGSRDAWIPDSPLPDAYIPPDAPIDTAVGGTGGSSATGGTGGATTSAPALHIFSFSVNNSGAEITVTAGKTVTLFWDVVGATTKEIDRDVGMVTGSSKLITVPSPTIETTYIYTLTVTNSTNDASTDFDEAHAEVKITVVPLAITSFKAEPAFIDPGNSSTLSASFVGNDKGTISNGVGEVSNGGGKTVTPTEPTPYTLTVTNRLGDFITATATVNVTGFDAGTGP
jgi:hypothetical protein